MEINEKNYVVVTFVQAMLGNINMAIESIVITFSDSNKVMVTFYMDENNDVIKEDIEEIISEASSILYPEVIIDYQSKVGNCLFSFLEIKRNERVIYHRKKPELF